MMRFSVLGSGSGGNSIYLEYEKTAILVDSGFSGIELEKRLISIGADITRINAIFVTHEHGDHVKGVGVLSRRYKIPVFGNSGTLKASAKKMGKLFAAEEFATGEGFSFQDFEVHPFAISHDTADPVGFTVSNGQKSVGICTDTGKVSQLMIHRLKRCSGLVLEFNHDPLLLKNGPRPLSVQQRVRSNHGHLANHQAASFLGDLDIRQLQYLIPAHLSEDHNHPDIVMQVVADIISENDQIQVVTAQQGQATPLFYL